MVNISTCQSCKVSVNLTRYPLQRYVKAKSLATESVAAINSVTNLMGILILVSPKVTRASQWLNRSSRLSRKLNSCGGSVLVADEYAHTIDRECYKWNSKF